MYAKFEINPTFEKPVKITIKISFTIIHRYEYIRPTLKKRAKNHLRLQHFNLIILQIQSLQIREVAEDSDGEIRHLIIL